MGREERKMKKKEEQWGEGRVKEECSIMYSGFCPGNCWLKCGGDTFEIGPGLPTKTERGAASANQSILSRHLLCLENPQILTFNSAGIQS